MTKETKQKIIEVGAEIIQRKGFNHTGIQEILTAAGVPKGSFYFYFKSKEDFGLQVIDYFKENYLSIAEEILNDKSRAPLERFQHFFNWFIDCFKPPKCCTCGCPIGNLSQEMSDLNPQFREKLNSTIDEMINCYVAVLKEAQETGAISQTLDTRETASFMVSSLQGALMHMKVTKNLEPLENWYKFIIERVLKS